MPFHYKVTCCRGYAATFSRRATPPTSARQRHFIATPLKHSRIRQTGFTPATVAAAVAAVAVRCGALICRRRWYTRCLLLAHAARRQPPSSHAVLINTATAHVVTPRPL